MAPVNSILTLSEIMMNGAMAADLSKKDHDYYLQVIWSSGKMIQYNVQSQLSQNLALTGSFGKHWQVEVQAGDLKKCVDDVLHPFSIDISYKKIQVNIIVSSGFPEKMKLNAKIFQEILFNIISNAVKFSKEDGSIQITLKPNAARTRLQTEVTDKGCGIPKDKIEALFKIFHNVRLKQDMGGEDGQDQLWLGLTNAKILSEALKGDITLSSKVGRGTTVKFNIEMAEVASQNE